MLLSKVRTQGASLLATAYVVCALTLSGVPGWSSLPSLLLVLLLILSVVEAARGQIVVKKWVVAPVAFLGICALWSILNWEKSATPLLATAAAWVGALLIAIHVQNGLHVRLVLRAMIVASLINAIAVLMGFDAYLLYVADFSDVSEEVLLRRPSGLIGNSNALAIQAILPLFTLALWKEGIGRATWTAAIVCAAYAFVASGSRKGLYLALFAVPFVAYAFPSTRSRNALLTVGAIVVAVFTVILFGNSLDVLPPSLAELEVLRRVDLALTGVDTSVLHRGELVDSGIEAFLQSPIFGYGLDAFRWVAGGGYYAHNNLLELAVNGGLVMIASYYYLYALSAGRANRAYGLRDRRRILHWGLLFLMLGLEFGFVSYRDKFFVLVLVLLVMVPATSRQQGAGRAITSTAVRRRGFASAKERLINTSEQ